MWHVENWGNWEDWGLKWSLEQTEKRLRGLPWWLRLLTSAERDRRELGQARRQVTELTQDLARRKAIRLLTQ